ncbi:EAL domain-containing protein [Dongia deserti]|uniref:EAL domain-containing protein n=1 Tax=Dongia deserti TaxID=2268030 RepID=UPI0013C428EF|nr:EAL domain-containing protein [Dongia deserti]
MNDWNKDARVLTYEELLLDFATRLDRHRAGRVACELHLSLLRPYHQQPHHLRIVRRTLEPLARRYDAGIYELHNRNLIILTKGAAATDIEPYVSQVRALFSEDPLFLGADDSRFCSWYGLERDYDALLMRARQLNEDRKAAQETGGAQDAMNRLVGGTAIRPTHLEQIERAIEHADLANILRRQDVCAVIPGMRPEPMFHELYFSMYYLAQTLLPGHNVTSDDFLFRHLTRVLDRRMLSLMTQRELFPMLRTAALNLNVRTVLSAEFMEFDKATNIKDRGSLAIELPALDIMNEPNEYLFARDFLKERGYKIVLDGVKYLNLPLIDREWLGFDFVKVTWTPSLLDDAAGQRGEALKASIAKIGRDRVVLCRVDSEDGLKAGEALGVTLYQGRLIDAMNAVKLKSPAAGAAS